MVRGALHLQYHAVLTVVCSRCIARSTNESFGFHLHEKQYTDRISSCETPLIEMCIRIDIAFDASTVVNFDEVKVEALKP